MTGREFSKAVAAVVLVSVLVSGCLSPLTEDRGATVPPPTPTLTEQSILTPQATIVIPSIEIGETIGFGDPTTQLIELSVADIVARVGLPEESAVVVGENQKAACFINEVDGEQVITLAQGPQGHNWYPEIMAWRNSENGSQWVLPVVILPGGWNPELNNGQGGASPTMQADFAFMMRIKDNYHVVVLYDPSRLQGMDRQILKDQGVIIDEQSGWGVWIGDPKNVVLEEGQRLTFNRETGTYIIVDENGNPVKEMLTRWSQVNSKEEVANIGVWREILPEKTPTPEANKTPQDQEEEEKVANIGGGREIVPEKTPTPEANEIPQDQEDYFSYIYNLIQEVNNLTPTQINRATQQTSLRYSVEDSVPPQLGEVVMVINFSIGRFGRPRPGYPEFVVTCGENDLCEYRTNVVILGARIVPLSDENPELNRTPIALVDFLIFDSKRKPLVVTGYLGNLATDRFISNRMQYDETYLSLVTSTGKKIPVIPYGGEPNVVEVEEIVYSLNQSQRGHVATIGIGLIRPQEQNSPLVRQMAMGSFPPDLFARWADKSRTIGDRLLNGTPEEAGLTFLNSQPSITVSEIINMPLVTGFAVVKPGQLPSFLEAAHQ